jgi:chemotaxis response regulator CheB
MRNLEATRVNASSSRFRHSFVILATRSVLCQRALRFILVKAMPPSKKAVRKKAPSSRKNARARSAKKNPGCPIVGIGGSAGGFEATMELLKELPPKNGMAFVIVQHLDPHHASRFGELTGQGNADASDRNQRTSQA